MTIMRVQRTVRTPFGVYPVGNRFCTGLLSRRHRQSTNEITVDGPEGTVIYRRVRCTRPCAGGDKLRSPVFILITHFSSMAVVEPYFMAPFVSTSSCVKLLTSYPFFMACGIHRTDPPFVICFLLGALIDCYIFC